MNRAQILALPSIPAAGPSYPFGPFHFVGREYMVVIYETDAAAIREALPEPLEPMKESLVGLEWIKTDDASGFGAYTACALVIPATFKGTRYNFVAQMFLNNDSPIAAGRNPADRRRNDAGTRRKPGTTDAGPCGPCCWFAGHLHG